MGLIERTEVAREASTDAPLMRSIGELHKTISLLDEVIEATSSRLMPIRNTAPAIASPGEDRPRIGSSPAVSEIEQAITRVDKLRARLYDIVSEVEC